MTSLVAAPTPETEYWTEAECNRTLRTLILLLPPGILMAFAFPIVMDCPPCIVPMLASPAMTAWRTVRIRRRIRQGQHVAKEPNERPAKTHKEARSRRNILLGLGMTLALFFAYFFQKYALPMLQSPLNPTAFCAALYSVGFYLFCLGWLWREAVVNHCLMQSLSLIAPVETAALSSHTEYSPSQTATEEIKPRHWWTESGTRAEVNEQRLGR